MPGGEPFVVPVRRDHPFTPNLIVVDEVSMLDVFPANKFCPSLLPAVGRAWPTTRCR